MLEVAYVFEKGLKCVGNDVDKWKMASICWKWINYLRNGLDIWEMT